MKKLPLLSLFASTFAATFYLIIWIKGESLPAYHALIWCAVVFVRDLEDYFRSKLEDVARSFP